LSISVDIGKKTGMSMWMSMYYTAINVGVIITPLVAGMIMDHLGIDVVFYLFGLLGLFFVLGGAHYIRKRVLT
jgi:MFS family permease